MARLAPLLPFARAPDVKDVLELMDISWFGPPYSNSNSPNRAINVTLGPSRGPSLSRHANPEEAAYRRQTFEEISPPRRTRPARQAKRQQMQVYENLEDGLGTWADRQQVFTQAAQMDGWDGERADVARQAGGNQPETPDDAYTAETASGLRHLMESSEDADMNAAWRWRFTRKWQQEQMRQLEGAVSAGGGDDDDWSSALDYMATAAGGLNLQFGRTSLDHSSSLSLDPSLSQTMLLLEASNPCEQGLQGNGTPGATNTPMATRHIQQAVRKAEELMAHQAEIERQVAERWESTDAQQPWAAQRIAAVTIDSWGSFPFILARVMDLTSGRQKLLVRGGNRFSVKQVTEALDQEVMMEATSRKLPAPRMDLLGSGKIEWSQERDRCVSIWGTTVHSTLDTRLRRKEDVGRVAGALVRTGLTALHTVKVENAHQAAQGTSSTQQ